MWPFKKTAVQYPERGYSPTVLGSTNTLTPAFTEQTHEFKRKFDLEIDSWCFGLSSLKEAPLPQVVFKVVRELRPVLREAIEAGYAFDIRVTAEKIFFAAKKAVPKKEVLFALLAVLPDPESLTIEQKQIFSVIVAQVEITEGGAVERVRQRWNLGRDTSERSHSVAATTTVGTSQYPR